MLTNHSTGFRKQRETSEFNVIETLWRIYLSITPRDEGLKKALSVLGTADMDVAQIGSLRGKDLDVVVVEAGSNLDH